MDRNDGGKWNVFRSQVVPYVGTWIEMCLPGAKEKESAVVPYVGTWIEIFLE